MDRLEEVAASRDARTDFQSLRRLLDAVTGVSSVARFTRAAGTTSGPRSGRRAGDLFLSKRQPRNRGQSRAARTPRLGCLWRSRLDRDTATARTPAGQ